MSGALQVNGAPEDAAPAAPAAHTPGPWRWDGNSLRPAEPDPDTSSVHTVLEREGGYGYLGSNWRKTLRELDADYALIAAAPELLAALREIADDYAYRFDMDSPSTNPGMKYVVQQARAAIAKATGAQA